MDKLAHFLAGVAVAAIFYPFGIVAVIGFVCLAAIGKELWDANGNGTPDVWDAIATIIGGSTLVIWYELCNTTFY